jgi:hypothetical protein
MHEGIICNDGITNMDTYTNNKTRKVTGEDNLFAQKITLLESMYIYAGCGHFCCKYFI